MRVSPAKRLGKGILETKNVINRVVTGILGRGEYQNISESGDPHGRKSIIAIHFELEMFCS